MKFRDLYLNFIAASIFIPKKLRNVLYKIYGIKIDGASICPRCFIGSKNLKIGKGTFVNYNCFFDTSSDINIGTNCRIGFKTTFITSTHEIGSFERRAGETRENPIFIGDGCWIGANVTILPGVTIERGCIIGAGSVVTKSCKENGVYVGNPAKRIKDLN